MNRERLKKLAVSNRDYGHLTMLVDPEVIIKLLSQVKRKQKALDGLRKDYDLNNCRANIAEAKLANEQSSNCNLIRELQAKLDKVRPYIDHREKCLVRKYGKEFNCDCGLTARKTIVEGE